MLFRSAPWEHGSASAGPLYKPGKTTVAQASKWRGNKCRHRKGPRQGRLEAAKCSAAFFLMLFGQEMPHQAGRAAQTLQIVSYSSRNLLFYEHMNIDEREQKEDALPSHDSSSDWLIYNDL